MILLKKLLLEIGPSSKKTDFPAISKKTGKLVYFSDKDAMDTALKAGTHEEPKDSKSNDKITQKGYKLGGDDFKSSAEKHADDSKDNDNNNQPSEELVNKVRTSGYGVQTLTLHRVNRNGKIMRDVKFTQEDITADLIKQAADDFDVDINLLNTTSPDTKAKDSRGIKSTVAELIKDLALSHKEMSDYAPGGPAESEYYYKAYSNSTDKVAKALKKAIGQDGETKKVKKDDDTQKTSYSTEEVSGLIERLNDSDSRYWVGDWKPNPKDILKVANRYGVDVNRMLTHPEQFVNIHEGMLDDDTPAEYTLKMFGWLASYVNEKKFLDEMSSELTSFQLAYPLKDKELSDSEWQKKIKEEEKNPTTVDGALRKFNKDENLSNKYIDKLDSQNRKSQSNWVKEKNKDSEYANNMMAYQQMISKSALKTIDDLLISDPPPPIKAQALYRGMAMKPSELNSFLKTISEGNTINLPISSFSLDPNVATGFSNNVANDNALISKANNQSVLIKVVNKDNTFNGFGMNSNIGNANKVSDWSDFGNWASQKEVLMPSNNQYKVLKTETKEMQGGRSFTIITLEQIGTKNEQFIKLKELLEFHYYTKKRENNSPFFIWICNKLFVYLLQY
jgi:hypothetical protein